MKREQGDEFGRSLFQDFFFLHSSQAVERSPSVTADALPKQKT